MAGHRKHEPLYGSARLTVIYASVCVTETNDDRGAGAGHGGGMTNAAVYAVFTTEQTGTRGNRAEGFLELHVTGEKLDNVTEAAC